MSFDFNDAGPQRSFEIIPADTIATLHMTVKSGGAGENGWLKRSKAGDSEALDCKFTVIDGKFAKRVFFTLFTIAGVSEGHAAAASISHSRLRAILESARNIKPSDNSDAAKEARRISSFGDLDGIRFIGKIGVEPAKENFKAKNTLAEVVTPDRRDWHPVEQVPKQTNGAASTQQAAPVTAAAAAAAPAIARPAWAR
jgi:hypothetical protein